jgi:hypothetical protein
MADSTRFSAKVEAPIVDVWDYWNKPIHRCNWNSAQDSFRALMAACDLEFLKKITYKLDDDHEVEISFSSTNGDTLVTLNLDAACQSAQKAVWQHMLEAFKNYAEVSYACC